MKDLHLGPGWTVSTRKGAAQWADSILPPSPRTAMTQEVGHRTSAGRKPEVNKNMVGKKTPHTMVQSSDCQLSPRGWMFERAAFIAQQMGRGGSSTSTLPFQHMQPSHAASLREYHRRRARQTLAAKNAKLERGWDGSKMTYMPPTVRGIKPITNEPWARDATIYNRKLGSFERTVNSNFDGTVLEEYNDESVLDNNNGYRTQVTATGLAKTKDSPAWDSSPYRACPYVLRGIKPKTREPWVYDEKIYNEDTLRDTTEDERAGGGALDLGSISHASRAQSRQVDREGFYMPSWEQWSASLSA